MKKSVELRIPRGTGKEEPLWISERVEAEETTTILEALEIIRRRRYPDLLYRHSCHHGSCGTCACLANGVERLACTTRLLDLQSDVVTLEPLRSARRLRDLAVFPDRLFESLPADWAYLRAAESGGTKVRLEDCIECGACISACPVRKDFVGPAALAAWSRELENRPERREEILRRAGARDGAGACQRNIFCSLVCPSGVAPAKKIMFLKGLLGRPGRSTFSSGPR